MRAGHERSAARPVGRNILILGAPGSGKSTLARRLADRLGLRIIHFDQLYWQPGWVARSMDEVAGDIEESIQGDGWVFDGNNSRTLAMRAERADTLIWLDLPRALCMARVVRRVLGSYGRTRPDMAAGCPERFDPKFLRWAWTFPQHYRPGQAAFFETTTIANRHRLTSPAEVRRFEELVDRTMPLPATAERLGEPASDRS